MVVSGVHRMNARRARLVLGWVTVLGWVYRASLICNQPSRSPPPGIPLGSLNRVPSSAGVSVGMSPLLGGR